MTGMRNNTIYEELQDWVYFQSCQNHPDKNKSKHIFFQLTHVKAEDMKAQTGQVTFPKSHSWSQASDLLGANSVLYEIIISINNLFRAHNCIFLHI